MNGEAVKKAEAKRQCKASIETTWACMAPNTKVTWLCTLDAGHAGDHEAREGRVVLKRWKR